jgi:uncharacterized membrane protein
MKKRISLIIMIIFYIIAGINHFRNPDAYYRIIPEYLPNPYLINIVSGIAEMIFAILLVFPLTRKAAAYGIIIMLIAFIPAHIVMIQKGWCINPRYCLPVWLTWVRLFPLQFLLMWWAWSNRK